MKYNVLVLFIFLFHNSIKAQDNIPVTQNLTALNIPAIPKAVIDEVKPYTESRSASLFCYHPIKHEMLISTRFGNTNQIHKIISPLGSRKQITFFDEAPKDASYEPVKGDYFLYTKDKGGNEFTQIYIYDCLTGKSQLLTNGKRTQNGNINWNKKGTAILYTATSENSGDRAIYKMDPLDPTSAKMMINNTGGGWSISDWNDEKNLVLINQSFSINKSAIWIGNLTTGEKTQLKISSNTEAVFNSVAFSNDGKHIYVITNVNSEFLYPAKININSGKISKLVKDFNWDISNYELNDNQTKAAFVVNEAGISKLFVQDLTSGKLTEIKMKNLGVISRPTWKKGKSLLAFNFGSYDATSDVFEWNEANNSITRWTESELGGMDMTGLKAPELIKWNSLDSLSISGFLYRANDKFKGKRPVIVNIHGGPEGQSLPVFIGRNNYYLNELGVSIIYPNVRGSVGYGKSYTDKDNGFKREESVQDIGALLDWIAQQPELDAEKVMITGGSYGGYMTLACATHYSDKIKCALDVVGISNFKTFLQNTESYRRDLRRVEYGDERDSAMLAFFEKISPYNNVDKIKVPLFIVQGKNDPRVPYTESQIMFDKLNKEGSSPAWLLMADDEGHGFNKKPNQDFQFYATVMFVKKYLLGLN